MKYLVTIIICLSFSIASFAKNNSTKVLENKLFSKVKKSRIDNTDLGLSVSVVSGAKVENFFNFNGSKQFIPASLTKIPTALAAYHYLGPNHKFETRLESDAPVKDGVLKGNLYFIGGGDPTFTSESMWSLVNKFKRENIHTIEKNIVVDDTYFDSIRYDKRRDPVRTDRAYDAPIGALSFNWNSVNIYVRPTSIGSLVQVNVDPTFKYFKVINKARTVSGRRKRLKISRIASKDSDVFPFETIIVTGTIGLNSKEYVSYKSITKPEIWAGYSLKKFLQEKGIAVNGKIIVGTKPQKTKIRAVFESDPLFESIKSMNKYSNNFIAEMLIKNVAAQFRRPATMDYGLKKVNEYLVKSGFSEDGFKYVNASGLTRQNFFKPKEFNNYLTNNMTNHSVYPEFLTSLPISAVDGTLKTRMVKLASAKKVRAKTGMLSNVIGLAGYINKGSKTYIFTFMYNGEPRKLQKARDLFDYMAEEISQH